MRQHGTCVRANASARSQADRFLRSADRRRSCNVTEQDVRAQRESCGHHSVVKQIDTLAAEYPAQTNYLYLTYNGQGGRRRHGRTTRKSVIVLGSGAYRIGSSVEFDWCCVNTVQTPASGFGYRTIVINYNPETVSTDYNECDTSLFRRAEPRDGSRRSTAQERPLGVIVSMGGQVPNNLALQLQEAGVPVLGTSPLSIDTAEDRHKFSGAARSPRDRAAGVEGTC